jgi:SAM-dependent methyltransferase
MFKPVRARLGSVVRMLRAMPATPLLVEENRFLWHETRRLNEQVRSLLAGNSIESAEQTKASFDYQWEAMPEGAALPSDAEFMADIGRLICQITDLPAEWFRGKRVVDIGSGMGRFTFGLLGLGAEVTACDQSAAALKRVRELCGSYGDRLYTKEIDLLAWDEPADFDLAFSFGVVHHTGNTYLAIRNVARKVRRGGRVFLMVYGWPRDRAEFAELNAYEDLRQELRLESFETKQAILLQRFGSDLAHGYFDAVSPSINDLMTFEELGELLIRLGFERPRRTIENRNLHVVADKRPV